MAMLNHFKCLFQRARLLKYSTNNIRYLFKNTSNRSKLFYPIVIGLGTVAISNYHMNQYHVCAFKYVDSGNINSNDMTLMFDTITPGFERAIDSNGKVLYYTGAKRIRVSDSRGHDSGKHKFKIRLDHGSFNQNYFGVYCEEDNTKYYCKSLGGIYEDKEKLLDTPRWRIEDKIEMLLDCDEGTIAFVIDGGIDILKIDLDKTYHVFVSAKAQPNKGWASGFTVL
eukprot:333231_1